MAKPNQAVKSAEAPVAPAPVVTETPVVTESPAVTSESLSVTDAAPQVIETPVVVDAPLPAGVLMASPAISDNGVEPGTSVTLADGTVITHN